VNCYHAVDGFVSTWLENVLFDQFNGGVRANLYATIYSRYCTFDGANPSWLYDYFDDGQVYFDHCLISEITQQSIDPQTLPSYTYNNYVAASAAAAYRTVGAGAHYLPPDSPYRNKGNISYISLDLQHELRRRTTQAPVLLGGSVNFSTALVPQATRDSDGLDIGYHYDPIDYFVNDLSVSDATLLLTNAVCIGVYGTNGFALQSGAKLIGEGYPDRMSALVRYSAVQERPISWGSTASTMTLLSVQPSSTVLPEISLRFFRVASLADTIYKTVFYDNNLSGKIGNFVAVDSQIHGVKLAFAPTSDSRLTTVALTNNLFDRGWITFEQSSSSVSPLSVYLRNNLFYLSSVPLIYNTNVAPWGVYDNVFDGTAYNYGSMVFANGNNGYWGTQVIPGSSGGDVTFGSAVSYWPTGPYGNFYYYGSQFNYLVNAGSRTAAQAGLYHYTTQTSLIKEGATVVDIGFHYVVPDTYFTLGNPPLDGDGDKMADYFEDRNGNGTFDTGDLGDWTTFTGTLTGPAALLTFTPWK